MIWKIRDREIDLSRRARVMGIINATPDSFSDGGSFLDPQAALAHGLQMVAEGAEIAEHIMFLRNNGCDTVQGFYYSRPVPAEEFERMIRQRVMVHA